MNLDKYAIKMANTSQESMLEIHSDLENSSNQLIGTPILQNDGTNSITNSITSTTHRRHALSMNTKAWITVAILTTVNLVNYMDRFSVAGVLLSIQKYYNITDTESGLLTTSFIISYMFTSLIFGYLGDRWNRKLLLIVGILFWAAVSLASSFINSNHFYVFLLLRALIGVGEASYSTIAPTIMADLFAGSSRTKAFSFFYFAIPVGGGIGYISASEVAAFMGSWQWALRVTPFLCFILSIVVALMVYEPSRGASDHSCYLQNTPWTEDLKYLSKHKSFILITLAFTCVSFVTGALALWAPKFLVLSILVQPATASNAQVSSIFGAITCASGILGVVSGSCLAGLARRYTRVGDPLVCAFGMLASTPFLFISLYISSINTVATYILIFIAEVLLFFNWALVSDMLMYVVIPTRRSTASSIQILVSHALGDAGSPPLLGKISDLLNKAPLDYRAYDVMSNFHSLQLALYVTCYVSILGSFFFLLTSFYIQQDRANAQKLIKSYLNEDDEEDRTLLEP